MMTTEFDEEVRLQVQMLVDMRRALKPLQGRTVPHSLRDEALRMIFDYLVVRPGDVPESH